MILLTFRLNKRYIDRLYQRRLRNVGFSVAVLSLSNSESCSHGDPRGFNAMSAYTGHNRTGEKELLTFVVETGSLSREYDSERLNTLCFLGFSLLFGHRHSRPRQAGQFRRHPRPKYTNIFGETSTFATHPASPAHTQFKVSGNSVGCPPCKRQRCIRVSQSK